MLVTGWMLVSAKGRMWVSRTVVVVVGQATEKDAVGGADECRPGARVMGQRDAV